MSSHLDFKLSKEQQAFCAEHVRLAYSEAHKFSRRTGIPYDDLIGAAHIGLAKGAHRFDPSMGYKPSTYLVSLIRGELLHHCRDKTYLLRISHRMRELWMRGRKFVPFGHSDQYIADELKVELSEWLECRHICSGPPLQLNETVHEVSCPGYHGKPRIVEDDRTEAYLDAARLVWDNAPKTGAKLFWSCQGVGGYETRVEALEALIQAACDVLDGHGLPAGEEEDMPLRAATYGGPGDEVNLHFDDEHLGNGRIQPGLF
ncbi:MAG: hypothetical protein CL959_01755 [Euryarchaeota archaeon]|mgnify:CR=1 FL=1|nr:hypothetical protein [Euryarchaeota archaeon]